jgi:hypothetical protein
MSPGHDRRWDRHKGAFLQRSQTSSIGWRGLHVHDLLYSKLGLY